MLHMQIPAPDVVAQAAGHLSRNAYYSYMTLDPLERPEFREMALMLFPHLEEQLAELKEVHQLRSPIY